MVRARGLSATSRFLFQRLRSCLLLSAELRRLTYPGDLDRMLHLLIDRPFGEAQAFFSIQRPQEIARFLSVLQSIQPRVVVEIGTAGGGTLYLLTRLAAMAGVVVSVDRPGGPFGGGYGAWRGPFYRGFARGQQRIELLRCDSHDPFTLQRLRSVLREQPIDVLLVDGDHSYDGVSKDFSDYVPLVRHCGVVALHDICPDATQPENEVARFWRDVRDRYPHEEIIAEPGQSGYGIGLLWP